MNDQDRGLKHYGYDIGRLMDAADDLKRLGESWAAADFGQRDDGHMEALSDRVEEKEGALRAALAEALGSVRACWDAERARHDATKRELADLRAAVAALQVA